MAQNVSTVVQLQPESSHLNSSKLNVFNIRSDPDTLAFLAFSVLLALVIIIGNVTVIAAFKHNPRLRRRSNWFLISLACSDCLVGVVSLPLWICLSGLAISTSTELYIFFITFDIFSALTSVFQLTVISLDRYISIARPFLFQRLPSNLYTAAIAVAWLSAGVLASMHPLQVIYRFQRYYAPTLLTVGFAGPLVVIVSVYAGIFRIARSLNRHSPATTVSMVKSKRTRLRQEIKMAMTLTIVTGLFFLAWLPFFVVLMSAVFCLPCLPPYPALQRLVNFVKWMHYSNSAVNPFVYALRDPEMKQEFARLGFIRLSNNRPRCRKSHSVRVQNV